MMTDCREDPCGECRYCRFEREAGEADLPDITPAAAGVDDPSDYYCSCGRGAECRFAIPIATPDTTEPRP